LEILLKTAAFLLCLALLQGIVGIVFFRRRAALVYFFFQTLFLFWSAVAVLAFQGKTGAFAGWGCIVLFGLFFLAGFRAWKKSGASAAPRAGAKNPTPLPHGKP